MSARLRCAACAWLLLQSGCFLANAGTDKKVSDAVNSLNSHVRWGRIDDAARLVEPEYRTMFMDHRRLWGREIQLGDFEVVNIQIASDAEHASAFVSYSWWATSGMEVYETTVRQSWVSYKSTFALRSEAVVRGDPRLLTPQQTSGGAANDSPSAP